MTIGDASVQRKSRLRSRSGDTVAVRLVAMTGQHISGLRRVAPAVLALCLPLAASAATLEERISGPLWYATTAALALALAALIRVALRNRALQREMDERQHATERELAARTRVETKLRDQVTQLEVKLQEQQATMDAVHRELEQSNIQLEATSEMFTRVARIDPLTGIANHRRFEESLRDEIKRMVREQSPLSLILGEIDDFREYRLANPEERVDEALKKVARAIENTFRRAGDLVARIGDSRFGIVLPTTDAEAAARFAGRLLEEVHGLCIPHSAGADDRITVSVGIATVQPNRIHSAESIIDAAEHALSTATRDGGHRYEGAMVA